MLAASHIGAATAMTVTMAVGGELAARLVPQSVLVGSLAGVAFLASALDLRAAATAEYACGLRRQTPRRLLQDTGLPWWVTPVIWGADTGTLVTTFRVTHATWVILLACFVGSAPPWIGILMGVWFVLPLIFSARYLRNEHLGRPGSAFVARVRQALQVVSAVLAASIVVAAVTWLL